MTQQLARREVTIQPVPPVARQFTISEPGAGIASITGGGAEPEIFANAMIPPASTRRSVADRGPDAGSMTIATRPSPALGCEACRVIQPDGLGTVTTLLWTPARWAL